MMNWTELVVYIQGWWKHLKILGTEKEMNLLWFLKVLFEKWSLFLKILVVFFSIRILIRLRLLHYPTIPQLFRSP